MNGTFYYNNIDSTTVLKFYDDWLVIGISVTKLDYEKELSWFSREEFDERWSKGKYTINNLEINFVLSSPQGSVIYRGIFLNDDSIEFEIESLINGHLSLEVFQKTLSQSLIENSDILKHSSEKKTNSYPIILIPKTIIKSVNKQINKKEILEYLNIETPKLIQIPNPYRPNKYKYYTEESIQFGDGDMGCLLKGLIISLIVFTLLLIISLNRSVPELTLFSIGVLIYLVYVMIKNINNETKTKKTIIPETEYNNLHDDFIKESIKIDNENEKFQKEYFDKFSIIDRNIQNSINETKTKIYYSSLNPFQSINSDRENIKRGRTEILFLNFLIEKFGSQIKVDSFLESNVYQPDFTFICDKTNLHIDIEIDEPYSYEEKEPIHHLDSSDDERNKIFLQENWCVIRFSEKQIVKEPLNCISVIENVINSILKKSLNFENILTKDKRWSYEESLVMISKNSRNKY